MPGACASLQQPAGGARIPGGHAAPLLSLQHHNAGCGLSCAGLVFQYLSMLRRAGPQRWAYDEMAAISGLRFRQAVPYCHKASLCTSSQVGAFSVQPWSRWCLHGR